MRSGRDGDRGQLERVVATAAYTSLLTDLQKTNTFLRAFRDWSEVIVFMRRGTSGDPAKDKILLPILQTHAVDQDSRWRTILLAIFWPGLESIWRRKRHWDNDPDTLWVNVTWAFLRTVCRFDPSRRFDRLVQKVVNDTFHALHVDYRREWDRTAREMATDPEILVELNAEDKRGAAAADLWAEQESRIAFLKARRAAGRISEADVPLLVGMHVYGRSLADCARESDLTYEVAKKRHQRAMKAIGAFPRYES